MDIIEFRDYCLSLPLSEETTPFDEDTLVYKIGGKMFAYTGMENFRRVSLKCEPDRIPELQEEYAAIGPPVHMSNRHWLSVDVESDLKAGFVRELILNSYYLVIKGMTKPKRAEILGAIEKTGVEVNWPGDF